MRGVSFSSRREKNLLPDCTGSGGWVWLRAGRTARKFDGNDIYPTPIMTGCQLLFEWSGETRGGSSPPCGTIAILTAGDQLARRPKPSAMRETTRVFKLTPSFSALAASLA